MATAAGADGGGRGWIFVVARAGRVESIRYFAHFADGVAACPDADAIGVDIPIEGVTH